jgi:hypothetical protein
MADRHSNPAGGGPTSGVADMQALAASAITALQRSDLLEEAQRVHSRVLTRAPEELLDRVQVGDLHVWTFKPMVELLLHEVRYLATASDLSLEERRAQVHWTLEACGF